MCFTLLTRLERLIKSNDDGISHYCQDLFSFLHYDGIIIFSDGCKYFNSGFTDMSKAFLALRKNATLK